MQTRILRMFISVFVLFSPGIAFSQGMDGKQPITIDDVMALKSVGDPQISPDGNWIAYTVRTRDMDKDKSRTRIWMVPASGGEAIAMTAADASASQPRWSPDNKYLSFVASKGENAKSQVWSLNRLGGEASQVTHIKQGVGSYEWSPDGSRLMLVLRDPKPADLTEDTKDDKKPLPHVIDRMTFKRDYVGYLDRRRNHIYVYTPGDDEAVQLTSGDYDDQNPVWSPDGKSIVFVSNRTADPDLSYNTDIWTVAVNGDDPSLTRVTAHPGRDLAPQWSPDSTHIAYISTTGKDVGGSALSPTRYLAMTEVGKDERRILTAEIDRNVSNLQFSANGKKIYFQLENDGQNHLASISTSGKNFQRVIGGPVSVRDYAMEGSNIVSLVATADLPQELFAVSGDGLLQLTHVNADSLADVAKPAVEKIQFASADGTEIEAFLVKPVGYDASRKYPLILWLHGGPASQFSYGFNDTAQLFAANGYAVVMPNPRGSTGYGEKFAKATVGDWGNKDFQDVMAAVDHVIDMGIADPDRMAVGGWSYGGILTNQTLIRTERFKAATSGASLGLYAANYGHDHYQLMYELEFGLPWQNREQWDRLSPFYQVEKITTPTLWMGGELDWNVPIINSEQMYIAMKRLGVETELVVYPGEHHGIRRPSFQKDRYERWLAWFGKYLKSYETASSTR